MRSNLYCTHFPYVIRQTQGGEIVILNRISKPLGYTKHIEDFDLDNPKHHPILKKPLTPDILKKLSIDGSDTFPIFLYHDKCLPWSSREHEKAYLKKLSILGSIGIR